MRRKKKQTGMSTAEDIAFSFSLVETHTLRASFAFHIKFGIEISDYLIFQSQLINVDSDNNSPKLIIRERLLKKNNFLIVLLYIQIIISFTRLCTVMHLIFQS